jgi:hypothetical protein
MLGTAFAAPFLEMLGCTKEQLVVHLQKSLPDGLDVVTAYGAWETDHIRPLASFDLRQRDQQFVAFHYTNLQLCHAMKIFANVML